MFAKFSLSLFSAHSAHARAPLRMRMAGMLAVFVVLANTATAVHAQSNFEEDFEDQDKPWQEIMIQLPAPPLAENLLPFYVSPTATQSFAVDAKSLTVGADGVVRYTLVSTSASGVKNISYEGIRCQLLQKKLYAFGRTDGTWSRSRRDQWEPIYGNAANRQHAELAGGYFCQGHTIAANGKAEEIIKKIRETGKLTPH
jgi:hypothetical protein